MLIIKFFPKNTFWLSSRLIQIGYLDAALKLVTQTEVSIKKHELPIQDRVLSMDKIRNNGLSIAPVIKEPIEKVNVLFAVHNSLPYDKAGYALRTHAIVTKLQKNSINLMVATRAGYPWDLQKHKHLDGSARENVIDSIKYLRLADDDKTFKKGSDFNYIKNYSDELIKTAKKNDITILHAHSNYLNALSAIKASNELGVPSVYEVRGLWHFTRLTQDPSYKYNGMFDYEQEMVKGAAKAADAVVTISDALKNLIVSWGIDSEKIIVVPNAVDTSLFNPQEKSKNLIEKHNLHGKIVVGFIGSITGYEGLDNLIVAVDELIADKYNISLIIVGDGNGKNKFEKIAKSDQIIFTGRVPFSNVGEYYSVFDICVYPRNNSEVCRYVPPLKPLEAMAMKKAVIVSDVAPLLEMIEDKQTGLVCKADDIDSLKGAVIKLYENKDLRERLATNANKWVVKNRSWDLVAEKYHEIYNSFK